MRAVDGGPDQPQASSQCRARPERQVLSQPTAFPVRELSPGRFGASPAPSPRCAQERSPPPIFRAFPRARRLLYVPEAEGTNPAPPTTCSRDRQTDMPARYPVAQLGTVSSRIQIPVSRPAFSNSELTGARSQNLTALVDYCSSRSLRYSE